MSIVSTILGFVARKAVTMAGGWQMYAIIGGLVLLLATSTIIYVQYLQSSIQTLQANQVQILQTVEAQAEQIQKTKDDLDLMRDIGREVDEKFSAATRQRSELERRFIETTAGVARSLTALALTDAKQLEDRINRGTRYALRCNEIVTGSPLAKGDETNTICPDLIKSKRGRDAR